MHNREAEIREQFRQALENHALYQQLVEDGAEPTRLHYLLHAANAWRPAAGTAPDIETWEGTLQRMIDPNRVSELVSTGISELDASFDGGLQPGGVTALVGGEAVGKSTLDKNISYNVAKRGTKAIIVTLEGGIAGYRMPMMALESGIVFGKIRSYWFAQSRPTQPEALVLEATIRRLNALPLVHSMTANTIDRIERLLDEHPGAKVISIDSMQLVSEPGREGIGEIEYVSKSLQRIAAERAIVVIALCEVNRVAHDPRDPVFIPDGFNIRGSRQLNHDFADTLLIARVKGSPAMRVIDGKGRHRADNQGDVFLKFDGAHQTVTDGGREMAERWEDDAVRARAEKGFEQKGPRAERRAAPARDEDTVV